MAVSFPSIPGNISVPLFYAEVDNSQAGFFTQNKKALLVGQKLPTGTAQSNTPIIVSSTDQARVFFGTGSMLARMHQAFRQQDSFGELWCIAVDDDIAAAAASGNLTITGPAVEAGTIPLYIGGQRVNVGVGAADTSMAIAQAITTAINAAPDLPVTASAISSSVTLTCKWAGATGNDVSVQDCFRGLAGGESLPGGVGIQYSAPFLTGGATNPDIAATVIPALGDEEYDFVMHPYTDSASLDAWETEFNDSTGRWSWSRQIYGHCYTALRGTLGELVAAGQVRNDPHHTIAAIDADCPSPCWEYAAAYGGQNAVGIKGDVARPTQTLPLNGIIPPRVGRKFMLTERQSLLNYGIATSFIGGGLLRVERAITTYQRNTWGQADPSFFDSETLHTLAEIIRRLRNRITQRFPRHKLANDGTRFGAGQAMVTPNVIRGEIISEYALMEELGIVENAALFRKYLIVERDPTNPNRVNVLLPPDLVNQLRIFALLNQFRLQYGKDD